MHARARPRPRTCAHRNEGAIIATSARAINSAEPLKHTSTRAHKHERVQANELASMQAHTHVRMHSRGHEQNNPMAYASKHARTHVRDDLLKQLRTLA
eukprot:9533913-Alexandrium_andersonii.AAC.1